MNQNLIGNDEVRFSRVVISQDFLRIEDGKKDLFSTPFKRNSRWMFELVGSQIIKALGGIEHKFIFGDENGKESLRWKIYSKACLPFCTLSWAKLYSLPNEYELALEAEVVKAFDESLVISFEMPDSILEIFTKNKIPYVDLSNHPIRFLPDYLFGIRTNVMSWQNNLRKSALSYDIVKEFARITKAKASRINVFENIEEYSVLFLGQMPIDSSLIYNGQIADEEKVKDELLKASMAYPKVWYKPHPHNKSVDTILKYCSTLGIQIADFNIYDCFGSGKFVKTIGLSSGGLFEAQFFDIESERLLNKPYYFADNSNEALFYHPIYTDCLSYKYWEHIINGTEYTQKFVPNPYDGAIKFSFAMKWGR